MCKVVHIIDEVRECGVRRGVRGGRGRRGVRRGVR